VEPVKVNAVKADDSKLADSKPADSKPADSKPDAMPTQPAAPAPVVAEESAPTAVKTAPVKASAKATKSAATKATPSKAEPAAPPRPTRSAAETEKIRAALSERRDELKAEYDQTMSEIAEAQRDRLTDSAGDDQADTGTKTFEREQEISLANNLRDRIGQVERALDRLDDGQYGWCERCGNAIPVERLAAFPSATLCVTCKQLEERR
jgi:DnaK suppressor protein